jgi:hypothetical protein
VSFALPAALLLLLALPGFIFIYMYKGRLRAQNTALVSNESMTLGWILGLVGSVVAHAVWVPLSNSVLSEFHFPIAVDTDAVGYLLAGEYKEGFTEHEHPFTQHPYAVLLYFGTLYVAAGVAGALLHHIVRKYDWDRRVGLLRFNNQWHYLFFPDKKYPAAMVTVTCHHRDHTCLYAGILLHYHFTSLGELERLVFIIAARAELSSATTTPIFTDIPGDTFMIWCKDVNTLNVTYLTGADLRRILSHQTAHTKLHRYPTTLAELVAASESSRRSSTLRSEH